jgi:hypothetical protein
MTRMFTRAAQVATILLCVCVTAVLAQRLVHWTHSANVSVESGTVTKTSGCDGCADAFAQAGQRVGAKGYAEFTIENPQPLLLAGLAHHFTPGDATSIDFGIRIQVGIAEVRENGVYRTDIAAQPGAVFRITVSQGVVSYSKDGFVFYSSPASKGALSFAALFADLGASISDVTISNGP